MDPAAIGTAMIGLERIRRDEEAAEVAAQRPDGPRREGTRGPWLSARRQLAAALRGAARRVEPASTPAS